MYTSFKNSFYGALVKTAVFVLPVFAVFSTRCNGDDLSWASADQTVVAWTSGPADASLGSLADIRIPKGYRFTDAAGAKDLLHRMKNPVPDGLVGILAPESGKWWAVLTYKNVGYVKDADKSQIDAAAILKTVSDRAQRQNEERALHGMPAITSVNWKLAPQFDAKAHTVEWAVQAKTESGQVINHTMRLLGRQGVLDATVVEPYQSGTDLTPLKGVMANISFKSGQRYTDYQKGDTVADIGLAGLITGQDDSAAAQNGAASIASKRASGWSWYWYVGVGALAGGSVLLLRRVLRRRGHETHHVPAVSPASNGISNGNGSSSRKTFAEEHASLRLSAAVSSDNCHEHNGVKPVLPVLAESGDKPKEEVIKTEPVIRNGSHHRRGARRKKVFDYHRFYTDTVLKLSSGSYTGTSNGAVKANGRVNGHSLDKTAAAQSSAHVNMDQTIVQAHLDLIANQKELIEEQKRLMIQQAKLIEEKSKLIAEKSQLLDRQTELFERDLL